MNSGPRLPLRTRDDALKYIITLTEPFAFAQLTKRLPETPSGTLSGMLSRLKLGGAVRRLEGENGTAARWVRTSRMPQSLEGARTLIARVSHREIATPRHRRRQRPVAARRLELESASDLVTRIREWQQKAAMLDRLIADLQLTATDLTPYQEESRG